MFYQNPIDAEFRGNMVLGDRQYILTFPVAGNRNKSDYQLAWNNGPYDFTIDGGVLTLHYAWDQTYKNYSELAIDVSGVVPAATTAAEVVAILNANVTFKELFTAVLKTPSSALPEVNTVLIIKNPGRQMQMIRVYLDNTGAEAAMRFNKHAGVAELPIYMERHTIENRFNWPDSAGMLVLLDETDPIDQAVIQDAGFTPADMLEDWQLFAGRSQIFNFRKQTVDGSSRVTEIIEYPAGAKAGDFARKTIMTYTAAQTAPDEIMEIPYTLQSGDLITP